MSLWRWCCFVTRLYRFIYFENKLIERNYGNIRKVMKALMGPILRATDRRTTCIKAPQRDTRH